MKSIRFYYYGVDPKTGNKKKFEFCFNHAVQQVQHQSMVKLYTEVIDDDDFVNCDDCYGDE